MSEQSKYHKLNEFGFMDYKKPLDKQQDMRTSTYLGHKLMNDTTLGNKIQTINKETIPYKDDPILEKHRISHYKANYEWKFDNPDDIRNATLDKKFNCIKPFYDCKLKFLERPMRPASSVFHSDYIWQTETLILPPDLPQMPKEIAMKKITIDRNKPGYSKYLDPAATTTTLDYCYRSPKDIIKGIAAHDCITFWNWEDTEYREKKVFREKDPLLCDKLSSQECTKRRCEFASKIKPVPNSGLSTEVRDNYVEPNDRAIDYNICEIRNDFTFMLNEPSRENTEYELLGSGKCTQNYV